MILAVGDIVRVDFPGNGLHGQRVRVERVKPEFDIAHPDCPEGPMIVEVIFISHPSLPEPVGIGRSHIAGTLENARWYAEERDEDDVRQGELLL